MLQSHQCKLEKRRPVRLSTISLKLELKTRTCLPSPAVKDAARARRDAIDNVPANVAKMLELVSRAASVKMKETVARAGMADIWAYLSRMVQSLSREKVMLSCFHPWVESTTENANGSEQDNDG